MRKIKKTKIKQMKKKKKKNKIYILNIIIYYHDEFIIKYYDNK